MDNYYNFFKTTGKRYQACGNSFLIVQVDNFPNWSENFELRQVLTDLGKEYSIDSVLVLQGDPYEYEFLGYHCKMDVYEPRSDTISTMCGNGVRAVYRYWLDKGFILDKKQEFIIKTRSGLRTILPMKDGLLKTQMGFLSTKKNDLRKYVQLDKITSNVNSLEEVSFPQRVSIALKNNHLFNNVVIGLTGDQENNCIDGEPHLIIFLNKNEKMSLQSLREYTAELGEVLSNDKSLFPQEINTSVVCNNGLDDFLICTYERGVYYVTQACGTATTVAGGYLLKNNNSKRIKFTTLGGQLEVEKADSDGRIFLTGDANSYNIPLEAIM